LLAEPEASKPAPRNTKSLGKVATDGRKKSPKEGKKRPAPAPKEKPTQNRSSSAAEKERVRKTYELPGQTRDTPVEEDPLRKFYTSLLDQVPESEMARRWCATHGLLSREAAEAWVEEQARKKGAKSPAKQRRPSSAATTEAARKRKNISDDDENDFKSTVKKPKSKRNAGAAPAAVSKSAKKASERSAAENGRKKDTIPDDESSESDEEIMPQAKKRAAVPPAAVPKAVANGSGSKVPPGRVNRDVAFADGGLDGTDSDDDVPLLQRKKTAA
jgi:hypothetical protein